MLLLIRPAESLRRTFTGFDKVVEMAPPKNLVLIRFHEFFARITPNRFEHEIPRVVLRRPGHGDERFIYQKAEQIDDLPRRQRIAGAHGFDGLERASLREDGQPAKQGALRFGEQIMAPVDQGTECLLARHRGAAAGGEQMKPIVQPLDDLLEGEQANPRGGQFDGERNAVESPADLRDEVDVVVAQLKGGTCRGRAVQKKTNGLELRQALGGRGSAGEVAPRLGKRERWQRPGRFARHAQRLAAAGQDAKLRTRTQQRFGEARAGSDEVFAIVEDEQEPLVAEEAGERGGERALGLLAKIERGRDAFDDHRGISGRGEFDEPNAVRIVVDQVGSHLQRQARLAGATRAGEREQARAAEQALHFGQFALAADEARELQGQIIRRAFERKQRRELGRQIAGGELEEGLGAGEIAQPMFTERPQSHARRQHVANEFLCGQRKQHLAAVGRGEDARHAIQRPAKIIALPQLRRARMQRHAHLDSAGAFPGRSLQRPLRLHRAAQRILRGIEGDVKRIADGLENEPFAGLKGLAQQPVVQRQIHAHGLRLLLPFTRAAFDVAEQEGDRSRGELSHGTIPSFSGRRRPPGWFRP